MPSKRPFSVTLLLWAVLILSVWGVTRFFAALRAWEVLYEFDASLSPLYLSITGAGWGAAGCVLLYGIWRGRSWARTAIVAAVLIWLIEYWLERSLFQPLRANLPFAIACSIISMVVVLILATLSGTKSFFTKSEEHEQPTENPNLE
jgi:hypothetical protein